MAVPGMNFRWHGNQAMAKVAVVIRARIQIICDMLEDDIKGSMKKGGSTSHGGAPGADEVTGTFHSAPGEVPRVQSGDLKRSITSEMHPMLPVGRVGTNLEYARPLELGNPSRNLEPRPFMRPAIKRVAPRARIILSRTSLIV